MQPAPVEFVVQALPQWVLQAEPQLTQVNHVVDEVRVGQDVHGRCRTWALRVVTRDARTDLVQRLSATHRTQRTR